MFQICLARALTQVTESNVLWKNASPVQRFHPQTKLLLYTRLRTVLFPPEVRQQYTNETHSYIELTRGKPTKLLRIAISILG